MALNSDSPATAGVQANPADDTRAAAAKLRTALLLFDSGLAMKRAQLRRQDPKASEQSISGRVAAWLRTRPGAAHGDAEGRPGALQVPS